MAIINIVFGRRVKQRLSIKKPNPIAAITCHINVRNCISNQIPKPTIVNSKISSQIPLLNKKTSRCSSVLRFLVRKPRRYTGKKHKSWRT